MTFDICKECRGRGEVVYRHTFIDSCKRCGGSGLTWYDPYQKLWSPEPPKYYSGKVIE